MSKKTLFSLSFFVLVLCVYLQSAAAATDPNLVGWWRFDDDTNDSSGLGNTGTLMGDASYAPGIWGRAIELDGVGDYVNCGNDPNWDITGSMTVMAWIKGPINYAYTHKYIVGKGNSWHLELSGTTSANFDVNGPLPTNSIGARSEAYLEKWSHVAGVYDTNVGELRVYTYDSGQGERSDINDANGAINIDPNNELWIGGDSNSSGQYWKTYIDDVRIYNRALSLDEIRAIRNDPCYVIARKPVPADEGTIGVNITNGTTTLKWAQAPGATKHDVYFGSTNPPPFMHRQQPADNNTYEPNGIFDPCGLRLGETSYWRINEVNSSGTYQGVVWRFTVGDYLLVDDFEFYTDTPDLTDTWSDEGGAVGTIYLKYETPGDLPWVVHQGNRYMILKYYNNGGYGTFSEANNTFPTPQDWDSTGVKSLTVWFKGAGSTNLSDKIYVMLADNDGNSATVTFNDSNGNPDLDAVKGSEWREWNIDLQDFKYPAQTAANDVNMSCVKGIHIGVGDRNVEGDFSSGTIYIDDIRLYKPRCVGQHRPTTDLTNDDCVTNYRDLDRMTETWLDAYCRPVLHYTFDINDVNITRDSSGYGYDGTLQGTTWVSGKIGSGARRFNSDYIEVPVEALSQVKNQITICLWTFGDANYMYPDPCKVKNTAFQAPFGNGMDDKVLGCYLPNSDGKVFFDSGYAIYGQWNRVVATVDNMDPKGGALDPDYYSGQWNHWAFTKNCDTGFVKIYINGVLWQYYAPYWGGTAGNYEPMFGTTLFYIGSKTASSTERYHGKIDDFRIYNRALSQADIVKIMNNEQLLTSPIADIVQDNRVNFKDYAVLTDAWLEEELWP